MFFFFFSYRTINVFFYVDFESFINVIDIHTYEIKLNEMNNNYSSSIC